MQGLRNEIQAHNRLRSRIPKRMAPPEKLAGIPSALPKMRLLKLQAPLPVGQHSRLLQLINTLACFLIAVFSVECSNQGLPKVSSHYYQYPMPKIEYPTISDSDIPSGSGGINREGYTFGQLRRQPIIPEIMRGICNPIVKRWAEECNERNRCGFVMTKVEGEYCFDGLRVGPKVKLPSRAELFALIGSNPTAEDIRNVSYNLLREEIARQTGMSVAKAASIQLGSPLVPPPRLRLKHVRLIMETSVLISIDKLIKESSEHIWVNTYLSSIF